MILTHFYRSNELSRRKTVSNVTSPTDEPCKSLQRSLTNTKPVPTRFNSIPENTRLQVRFQKCLIRFQYKYKKILLSFNLDLTT